MGKFCNNKIVRSVAFFLIFVLLFLKIQGLLTPKIVYPYFKDDTADMVGEFAELEVNDVQAIFIGSSHFLFSVDPMRIYKTAGLVTYNLASAAQPYEVSYYMLKHAFQTQSPRYVFLTLDNLFSSRFFDAPYRYVLESLPIGKVKSELAWAYARHFSESKQGENYLSAFIPMIQYHDRWSELRRTDFFLDEPGRDSFSKGFYMSPGFVSSGMYATWMNEMAEINASGMAYINLIENGTADSTTFESVLYKPQIDAKALELLLKIKALCDENAAELQLIAIPVCIGPQALGWTEIKSDMVRQVAAENGIPFLDLMYDTDIGIDWTMDSCDGGNHLNWRGARKVSDYLAEYLQEECNITPQRDENYEKDIPRYEKFSHVADLMMTDELAPYLKMLETFDDITVFLSVSDDMRSNLRQEDIEALNDFGLQTDFNAIKYSDAYLAIKERDSVLYEASSNRTIKKAGSLKNGSSYSLTSSGWRAENKSGIMIDGVEYSMNHRGINIVVYDNESNLVLDSVAFDTWSSSDQTAIRNYTGSDKYCTLECSRMEAYLLDYKRYLLYEAE